MGARGHLAQVEPPPAHGTSQANDLGRRAGRARVLGSHHLLFVKGEEHSALSSHRPW